MQRRPTGILALGLILASLAFAAPPPAEADAPPVIYPAGSEPQPPPSPILWDGPIASLGSVRLDSAAKTVAATGWVNQLSGAIEVLAAGPKGKLHEAAFVLHLNPLDLQAALLLAGLKGGAPMEGIGKGPPEGTPVDIFVEWDHDGQPRRERAEAFVWQIREDAPLPEQPWIFTGSMVKDGRFMAFAEETLVATYWDPQAIVNVPPPFGDDDERLHANPRLMPPFGTPIRMVFAPRP
jgi:hypothetical protein